MICFKKKKETEEFNINKIRQGFIQRTLKFTETVVVWITVLYIVNWLTSVVLITLAIIKTMNFAYLDTLITETSETFRTVVGMAIIKFGIENIFKYNDFGGHIPSKPEENLQTNDSELESNINESETVIETVENTNNEGGSVG